MLNGAFIKNKELQKLQDKAFNSLAFDKVFKAVNNQGVYRKEPVRKKDLKVKFSYKGEILADDNNIVLGKQINFVNSSNTIILTYFEVENVELPMNLISKAQVILPESKKIVAVTLNQEGKTEISVTDDNYQGRELPEIKEELPDNPNFDSENKMTPFAWWTKDGCLPGGYQHCGGNCGYYPREHGGGTPVNHTDSCCVLHDRCYKDGIKKCSCNTMLYNCVKDDYSWAAAGIQFYFDDKRC